MFTMAHFNFNVRDLEASLRFYEEALGLHEVRRVERDGYTLAFLADSHNSPFALELTWLHDHAQPYDLGENEIHLAVTADDFDAAHKKHADLGCIAMDNEAIGIYFVEDPDGYWIEILRPKARA